MPRRGTGRFTCWGGKDSNAHGRWSTVKPTGSTVTREIDANKTRRRLVYRPAAASTLAGPGRLNEQAMLFAQVPSRRCHDGTLANDDFTILSQGLTDVVFAYELGRFFTLDG